ncbi:MAG TPA: amino acid permease, partial [Armatimonadota bacterium]|nr:amino acid permease [Armatimonadota bacterium]
VYLREAYGPLWGFLFGWMEFWVARAGSVATVAVGFAIYAGYFTHLEGDWGVRWTAFLVVFALTVINYLGVRWGGAIQVLFTATKVAALGALVVCAIGLPGGSVSHLQPFWSAGAGGAGPLASAVGLAMINVLWAYDGWANGAAVSEEMKDPQRNVPRALLAGTALVTAIYLAVNLAYHYVLPMAAVASAARVIADAAHVLLGPVGAGLAAAAVLISTFGSVNGMLLTGPRIFHAMARDRLFFREMGELHPRFRTPHTSILFQGLWSSVLILVPFNDILNRLFGWKLTTPLFDQLLAFVVFASWLFYGMTVAGLLVQRKTRPTAERPYRAWGAPWVPLLFVLTSIAFVLYALVDKPVEAVGGLLIVLSGLPAYWWWNRRQAT